MTRVLLTVEDYDEVMELASFNSLHSAEDGYACFDTVDADGNECIIDLTEAEALTLRTEGIVETQDAASGLGLTVIGPDYDPADG